VETIYKGKIRPFGKTKGSLKEIPIPQDLSDELLAWRQVCQEGYDKRKPSRGKNKDRYGLPPSDPEAFIFPGRFGSFMDPSNYRKRVLHKLAEDLGLPKLNFQVNRTLDRGVTLSFIVISGSGWMMRLS
jgi:integrase